MTNNNDQMTDHPNYPFMQGNETNFGIELEVAIPVRYGSQFSPSGYSQMQGSQIAHYPQGWKATYDGSIDAPAGYKAVEIVSPKLKGFDGIVQIVTVLDDLNSKGAVVNSSTGIHIHVDGSNLDIRDIKKVKQMYVIYEKLFFSVLGDKANSRYTNYYCKPSSEWNDNRDHEDKYRSLNLVNWHNYDSKKTVEFRLFSGEGHGLNPENVVTYVMMSVALIVYARNCSRVHKIKTPKDLKDLCKKFITNVMAVPCNQIFPEYEPEPGDSLYKVLYEQVPNSTVTL